MLNTQGRIEGGAQFLLDQCIKTIASDISSFPSRLSYCVISMAKIAKRQ